MRALITGASGFVGGWLARHLSAAGDEVIGASRSGRVLAGDGIAVDLADGPAVKALSHVGRSWEDPAATFEANVGGAVALLEAVTAHAPEVPLLWASTCEVYGRVAQLPVDEDAPLAPVNPYAVSKAAGDMLAGVYADAHGLRIFRARPFNHSGPGQLPIFLISSLAEQAARARLKAESVLRIVTGNPDTRRDYTDVRDVCGAYHALVSGGAQPGIYNVCSGVSVSARELVELVGELINPIRVDHEVDPSRVRAHEVMDHRGDGTKLALATGWTAKIPLRQTIGDTIAWWEQRLS
jgi:GDP-4-dehydro-6-deoxy-D-mannose reductase